MRPIARFKSCFVRMHGDAPHRVGIVLLVMWRAKCKHLLMCAWLRPACDVVNRNECIHDAVFVAGDAAKAGHAVP